MEEDSRKRAKIFFEELWRKGDPWAFDGSQFEHARYDALVKELGAQRYGRTLEIGCGSGSFTKRLLTLSDEITAIDVSSAAISKAKERFGGADQVDFRVVNAIDYDPVAEGPFDLVVLTETIYYLGWLHSFFELTWFALQLFAATKHDGKLLLANTEGVASDYLLLPCIIRTYHDLFQNVGYVVESQKTFRGVKDGETINVLISVFRRLS
jgi:SAM-dependent methyltransferase